MTAATADDHADRTEDVISRAIDITDEAMRLVSELRDLLDTVRAGGAGGLT